MYVPTPEVPEYSFDGHSHLHYQLTSPLPARRTWVQVLVRTRKHSSSILSLISKEQSEYLRLEVSLPVWVYVYVCVCMCVCVGRLWWKIVWKLVSLTTKIICGFWHILVMWGTNLQVIVCNSEYSEYVFPPVFYPAKQQQSFCSCHKQHLMYVVFLVLSCNFSYSVVTEN